MTALLDFSTPGLQFVVVRHDEWCPGVHGDGDRCICNPTWDFVDEAAWTKSFVATQNRAQRRKAARAAKAVGRKGT
jgi:hypothetical protein